MKGTLDSKKLDLNLLQMFTIVYQERNLKRAASRLASTPSSLSLKLSRLKSTVGGELFVKVPTGFEPTELADDLYRNVEPLLAALHEQVNFAGGFEPAKIDQPIKLDLGQNLMPWLSPLLYQKLSEACPDSYLSTNFFTISSISRLQKGQIDVGIQLNSAKPPKDIVEISLGKLEMTALVRHDHPLVGRNIGFEETLAYKLALFEQSLYGFDEGGRFLQQMNKLNIPTQIGFRSPSFLAVKEVLKHSDMVMPGARILAEQSRGELVALDITNLPELTSHTVSAYIHYKNRYSAKHLWLCEVIGQYFT